MGLFPYKNMPKFDRYMCIARDIILCLIVLVFLFIVTSAEGTDMCVQKTATWFDTSNNCSAEPRNDRVFGLDNVRVFGRDYLLVTGGNEIELRYMSGSQARASYTRCNIDNVGDSDYDLMGASLCDDCTYGASAYKAGFVVYRISEYMDKPRITEYNRMRVSGVDGVFTYKHDGEQYLVAYGGVIPDCSGTAVARIDGLNTFTLVQCFPGWEIVGGKKVDNRVFFITDSQYLFLLTLEPNSDQLTFVKYFSWVHGVQDRGFDVEGDILAIANYAVAPNLPDRATLLDISTPTSPVVLGNVIGEFNRVRIMGDYMLLAKKGATGSEVLYDISDKSSPKLMSTFSTASTGCYPAQGIHLYGGKAFLARYSLGESYSLEDCVTITPEIFSDGFESGSIDKW